MSFELPDAIPHLTEAEAATLTDHLMRVFGKGDAGIYAAKDWLSYKYNGVFHDAPIEYMKRGPDQVQRVIDYLRQCPS